MAARFTSRLCEGSYDLLRLPWVLPDIPLQILSINRFYDGSSKVGSKHNDTTSSTASIVLPSGIGNKDTSETTGPCLTCIC